MVYEHIYIYNSFVSEPAAAPAEEQTTAEEPAAPAAEETAG